MQGRQDLRRPLLIAVMQPETIALHAADAAQGGVGIAGLRQRLSQQQRRQADSGQARKIEIQH
ncbi:hypothetical protein [Chromobacterium sphagni]|uniref:hypothetical protein n=1 Tax=Chromobacterium sphagni TaxID=1903179 RepID=UPI001F4EC9D9|nr:hypothetical protein [Chromobacterium sphagni]